MGPKLLIKSCRFRTRRYSEFGIGFMVWDMRDYIKPGGNFEPADSSSNFSIGTAKSDHARESPSLVGGGLASNRTRELPASLILATDSFREIRFRYETSLRTAWCFMNPAGMPRFTLSMMSELDRLHAALKASADPSKNDPDGAPQFYVGGSLVPGVFNLGGDLEYFIRCIRAGDAELLRKYARACIRISHDMN